MTNSNATAHTRADFLADLGALIGLLGAGWKTQSPIDRAYVADVEHAIDGVIAKWRERAPRTCESVDCDVIVTEPLDVLCPSCKAGGAPTRRDVMRRDADEGRVSIAMIARDFRDQRKLALAHRICDILGDTLQVRGREHDTDDVRVNFTDASIRVLAPLIDAIDILEAIIWASDGCHGHHHCAHSMEAWQRARALLAPKWRADIDPRAQWPDPKGRL